MKDVSKQKLCIIILCVTTVLNFFLVSRMTNVPEKKIEGDTYPKVKYETNYIIALENDKVVLKRNGTAIKEYDVNITLLPGEDILILTEGVSFETIGEADMFMEDYDG